MYRIEDTGRSFDIPNVLHAVDGYVYLDEYTHEPHIVVAYKDHYVDYEWNDDSPAHYWVDAREISPAEFAIKPNNVTEAKKQMYFYLNEKWEKRSNEISEMARNA